MKSTVKMFFIVAFLSPLGAVLSAKEPDAFFYTNPKANSQTTFVQKTTRLPEWESFRTLFCDAVDKAVYSGLTDRKQLENHLSPEIAEQVVAKVGSYGFSIREVVDKVTEHLEAVVVMAEETDSRGFVGAVALIGSVDPSQGLVWLPTIEGISEGKDYKFLKKESNGDFILQTTRRVMDRDVSICCAGLKLPGNYRFALIFSNDDGIQKYFDAFKKGQTGEEYAKGYANKLVVNDRCFRALEKIGKEKDWPRRVMDACGRINGAEIAFRDLNGTTQVEVKLSLKQEDDAKAVRDLVLGTGMFVQIAANAKEETSAETKELARQAANFLQTIKAEANGKDVIVTLKLDGDDFWNIISSGLKKANNELKQTKDFSSFRNTDWQGLFQRHIMSIIQ